jgi:TRAP transporter TAXI family solute receptor
MHRTHEDAAAKSRATIPGRKKTVRKTTGLLSVLAVAAAASAVAFGAVAADKPTLPGTMVWTAYGVGSQGYNESVAIGSALKKNLNVNLRVQPGKNDISRMAPLRDGKVKVSANGVGTYFGQEGVFEFAAPDWGPQPLRILIMNSGESNIVLGTAADVGIKTMADLKGKRVSWTVGAPALNHNIASALAFAGLTWDDVIKVEVPGFNASWDAIVNGQSDAAFSSTVSGLPKKLEASPRGLFWPPMPHSDKAGWARVKKIAPYTGPHIAEIGAGGISKEKPHEGASYPYPVLTSNADLEDDLVYNLVKAIDLYYDDFKDASPGIGGWAVPKQVFDWAVPYHNAAVKYYKEKGLWTEAHQKHNDALVKRQGVLAAAWKATKAKNIEDADKFAAAWLAARKAALEKAGMDVVF